MKHLLKVYLDLARAELHMAAGMRACGYDSHADEHLATAKDWLATYWAAKPV